MKPLVFLITNLLIGSFFSVDLFAQQDGEQISFGEYRKIYSQILKEERMLLINLPEDYHQSNKQYPVIYQLDGSKDQYLRGISAIKRLTSENRIPENIYVAIANIERDRDMYPFETNWPI